MMQNPKKDPTIHQMLRVNQAGEHGAVRIYQGQLAVLRESSIAKDLEHMAHQEKEHKKIFDALIVKNQVRPTLLSPLWHIAGFALGATTALMGKKAAMACTVAVEEVIDKHYQAQLDTLKEMHENEELVATIEKCQAEELEHRDLALEKEAKDFIGYGPLHASIQMISKCAIWLSKRV
jgi:ubiquinone biosynthesis monooxygenase Coq7